MAKSKSKHRRVIVNKIGVQIGDSEHELSLTEARALHSALDDLLGACIEITPGRSAYPTIFPVPVWPRSRSWSPYWTSEWRGDGPGSVTSGTMWLSQASS